MDSEFIYFQPPSSVAAIQDAIDTAAPGTTILLGAGTFVFDQTLVLNRSDIALEGAGSDKTIITAARGLGDEPAIQVGHELFRPEVVAEPALAAAAREGASTLRLQTGHGIEVGDHIYLSQENTEALYDAIGDDAWRRDDTDLRTFLVEVTAVAGNSVQLASKLPFDFDPRITAVEHRAVVEDSALSGFTLRGSWGKADPGDFSNTAPQVTGSSMMVIAGTSGLSLSDIAIEDAASHGITFAASTGLDVSDIRVEGALNKGGGGNGYGLWVRDVYDSTFTGLEVLDTRHALLFASYASANGNRFEVTHTNRDINLHGGLDQNNSVTVLSSIRKGVEADYMAPVFFINEGTDYGGPTDPDANSVVFQVVRGTVRAEAITADDTGVTFHMLSGADTVVSGSGDDFVDLGSGHDVYVASAGNDTVLGDGGVDTARFGLGLNNYATWWNGETLIVQGALGTTTLTEFETIDFGGITYNFDAVPETTRVAASRWGDSGRSDLPVVDGGRGWEREGVWVSSQMGADLNAIRLNGRGDIDAYGNSLNNHMLGNGGNNRLEGGSGKDRLVGLFGDDMLLGGDGNDALFGGHGDDTLVGGPGADRLYGGRGADLFVASAGNNDVYDFNLAQGDRVAFDGALAAPFERAFDDYLNGRYRGRDFDFDIIDGGDLRITGTTGASITLHDFTADDIM
ncbi:MAG: calcium-binding protein [Pseudomonadota bacterium]